MEAVPFQTLESVLRMCSSFRMVVEEWEYEWVPFLGIPIRRTCGGLYPRLVAAAAAAVVLTGWYAYVTAG